MQRHFMRHKWLYLGVVVLTVWPIILVQTWRGVPGPDEASVNTLVAWMDEDLQQRYGKHRPQEAHRITYDVMARSGITLGDPRLKRLERAPHMLALAPEVEYVSQHYRQFWREWDAFCQDSVASQLPGEVFRSIGDSTGAMPDAGVNYLTVQVAARTRLYSAGLHRDRGEWDAARADLRGLAHMADGVRSGYLIGHLIAIVVRGIAYGGYARLLPADPPPEVLRAALDDLVALRETEPYWDPMILLQEHLAGVFQELGRQRHVPRPGPVQDAFVKQYYLQMMLLDAGQQWQTIASPPLRAYLQRHGLAGASVYDIDRFKGDAGRLALQWTGTASAVKFLRRALQEYPQIADIPGVATEVQQQMHPWTRLFITRPTDTDLRTMERRTRVMASQRRALELAFAARLYRHEHDRWPASVEELVPAYVPAEMQREGKPLSFQTEQIATLDVDHELAIALYDYFLPVQNGAKLRMSTRTPGAGWYRLILTELPPQSPQFARDEPYLKQPVLAVAVLDSLLAYPQLIESATPLMRHGDDAWVVMNREYARRVTDFSDAPPKADPANLNMASQEEQIRLFERNVPPAAIFIEGKLKKPDRVFATWTPGPDEDDDGGRIAYDPTNGITSNGDIVEYVLE